MRPLIKATLSVGIFLLLLVTLYLQYWQNYAQSKFEARSLINPPPRVISHGGSFVMEVSGKKEALFSSNSLEALNKNYQLGHAFFETDFEWTADKHLVAIHDWLVTWKQYFPKGEITSPNKAPSLEQFMAANMRYGLHQLTPERLNKWLREHSETYIVTDIKARNLEGLEYLLSKDRELVLERYIPQIYHYSEYEPVKKMGFKHIIFTLYMLSKNEDSPDQLFDFVSSHDLYAVTMHTERIEKSDLISLLAPTKIPIYAHPVTSKEQARDLFTKGIWGFYSYFLAPR